MHPEFPELGETVYLEHAHRGPLPERARRAVEGALALAARGVSGKEALQLAAAEGCGRLSAVMLEVPSNTVRYTQNTTDALALVAAGIDWRAGDRVVTSVAEWPSAIDVWRRPGVHVEVLPVRGGADDERLDYDLLRQAVKGARVLSLGAVSLATGERRNLELLSRMAHREGALFVVDGAQAVGALEVQPRVLEIDALAGCTRKWLLGPPGGGFLYVRDGASIALPPQGALAEPIWAGLAASIEWFKEVGGIGWTMRRIEEEVLARAKDLAARARSRGFEVRGDGPIVRVLEARIADPLVIGRQLPGEVRFSPHFWNSLSDMERAASSLIRSRTGD